MRSTLCVLLVCLFTTTAAAQFSKGLPPRDTARTTEATPRKTADKAHTDRTTKAADQAAAETDLANALLAIIDTDGDGIVTKIEMAKALAALHKVKKDKQGNITYDKPADAAATAGGDPTQAAPIAGAEGVRGNNEAMARFMKYDINHDGKLTREEVSPREWAMAQNAGLVRNGAITAQDWELFIRKMGDRMKAGAAGAGQNAGGVPGDGQKLPRNDK